VLASGPDAPGPTTATTFARARRIKSEKVDRCQSAEFNAFLPTLASEEVFDDEYVSTSACN
jgi:hypothetical protein